MQIPRRRHPLHVSAHLAGTGAIATILAGLTTAFVLRDAVGVAVALAGILGLCVAGGLAVVGAQRHRR